MTDERTGRSPRLGTWLLPVVVLGGTALVIVLISMAVDATRHGIDLAAAFRGLLHVDVEMAWNNLGNLAQVVAAILGIAITVVSIVVELAANRYTPRITDLFIRDPVNFAVLGFFLVSCLVCVWISVLMSFLLPGCGPAPTLQRPGSGCSLGLQFPSSSAPITPQIAPPPFCFTYH